MLSEPRGQHSGGRSPPRPANDAPATVCQPWRVGELRTRPRKPVKETLRGPQSEGLADSSRRSPGVSRGATSGTKTTKISPPPIGGGRKRDGLGFDLHRPSRRTIRAGAGRWRSSGIPSGCAHDRGQLSGGRSPPAPRERHTGYCLPTLAGWWASEGSPGSGGN